MVQLCTKEGCHVTEMMANADVPSRRSTDLETVNFTITKNWKGLFVDCYTCKTPILSVFKFMPRLGKCINVLEDYVKI